MSERLSDYIIIVSALILLSLGAFFIGFFEGPQIGHYVNISTLILNSILILKFVKGNKTQLLKAWNENRFKLILVIFGILIHLFIAITFILVKYGYTNWIYTNPIKLIPPH